jgi:hypothetical protein
MVSFSYGFNAKFRPAIVETNIVSFANIGEDMVGPTSLFTPLRYDSDIHCINPIVVLLLAEWITGSYIIYLLLRRRLSILYILLFVIVMIQMILIPLFLAHASSNNLL